MLHFRWPAIAVAAVIVPLAGCGSHTSSVTNPQVIAVHDSANGTTVSARVGDTVVLTLSSSYWHVAGSSAPRILRQYGPAALLPRPSDCPAIPGLGCVPIRVTFKALTDGTAIVKASRTICGEALRCGKQATHFTLTVLVKPSS